ncbi:MAG: hypothetical protein AAB131_18025, partial [Actinomycetota bacterium]
SSGTISNFAGDPTGTPGNSGDTGLATDATLTNPSGVWGDNAGNIYIVDKLNSRIRKVNSSGTISNFAGDPTGTPGNSVDGIQATLALLNFPQGIWGDKNGNLYIVDTINNRIRKVDSGGVITNFAGQSDGSPGSSGDAGLATDAFLETPQSVWGDNAGNIYISDTTNNRIRVVDSGGNINNFAGQSDGSSGNTGDGGLATSAYLQAPQGVWGDNTGNIYIIDFANNRLRKVNSSGNISNFSGVVSKNTGDGGQATTSMMSNPWAVWVDNIGNIFICDSTNNRIRKVSPAGVITNFAGSSAGTPGNGGDTGLATDAFLEAPKGIWGDNVGNIYISDSTNNRVRKIDPNGIITNFAGSSSGTSGNTGDTGAAVSATLNAPGGLWGDNVGNIYIADTGNHRIR